MKKDISDGKKSHSKISISDFGCTNGRLSEPPRIDSDSEGEIKSR